MELEVRAYCVPEDKLYAVVELNVPSSDCEDGESFTPFACVACTKQLSHVTRTIHDDAIRYEGDLLWPKDETELPAYLQKPRTHPPTHWLSHSHVRILKFCATLGQAKTVSHQATSKTDFTESDVSSKRKRFRQPVNRFTSSLLNDASDSSDDSVSPPRLKTLKIQTGNGQIKAVNRKSRDVSRPFKSTITSSHSPEREPERTSSCSQLTLNSTDADTSTCSGPTGIRTSSETPKSSAAKRNLDHQFSSNGLSNGESSPIVPRETSSNGCPPSSPKTSRNLSLSSLRTSKRPTLSPRGRHPSFSPGRMNSAYVTHRIFMREMQDLKRRCDKFTITINKVYNSVCPVLEATQENGRGIPKLPNASFEDIVVWEDFLKDNDNALHIVRLLTDRCSAATLRDSVNGMMRLMLSNKLACSFNLRGKNKAGANLNKVAFEHSKSYTCILAGVTAFRRTVEKSGTFHYSTTPEDVGNAVGKWLKDAPKRFFNDLKNDKELPATATKVPPRVFPPPTGGF